MGLAEKISENHKEIAGSRTKNRLTVQISYAIQLIIDFYTTDFLVMMDYIEDVSVIVNHDVPTEIHLYQIKTKTSDKQYLLSTVIHEKWYQKLYANAEKYKGFIETAAVVCNTDIVQNDKEVFPNEKTRLTEKAIKSNVGKIVKAIAEDQKINNEDVDLSKFYFIRAKLSTKGHKEEAEYLFENFLLGLEPELQLLAAKSIFKLLYDELDTKFNAEINEDCTDTNEIFSRKGIKSTAIKDMISCGLAIQLPTLDKLFNDFNIVSVSEKRAYSSVYSKIKMDMVPNIKLFIDFKRDIINLIDKAVLSGVDYLPDILDVVFNSVELKAATPEPYGEEKYIKLLIMILAFKYCYGGATL